VYLICITGNYSIARKRGHWPAFKNISLPTLPYLYVPTSAKLQTQITNLDVCANENKLQQFSLLCYSVMAVAL